MFRLGFSHHQGNFHICMCLCVLSKSKGSLLEYYTNLYMYRSIVLKFDWWYFTKLKNIFLENIYLLENIRHYLFPGSIAARDGGGGRRAFPTNFTKPWKSGQIPGKIKKIRMLEWQNYPSDGRCILTGDCLCYKSVQWPGIRNIKKITWMFVHGAAVNIDDADPSLLSRMIRQIFTDDPSLA